METLESGKIKQEGVPFRRAMENESELVDDGGSTD